VQKSMCQVGMGPLVKTPVGQNESFPLRTANVSLEGVTNIMV
jgi:hypothetical protein